MASSVVTNKTTDTVDREKVGDKFLFLFYDTCFSSLI